MNEKEAEEEEWKMRINRDIIKLLFLCVSKFQVFQVSQISHLNQYVLFFSEKKSINSSSKARILLFRVCIM
jgi:hypothetical protein